MQEGVKRVFRGVMAATLDQYGKTASAPVLRLWWAYLEPYTIDEVRFWFTKYVRSPDNGTFPPKPADIIRMIEGRWCIVDGVCHNPLNRTIQSTLDS